MLDEERGALRGGARLAYGLSAALLSDLAQLGRARVSSGAVRLTDDRRTGHSLLDEHLAQLRSGPQRTSDSWIELWARPSLAERVAERLVLAGTLAVRTDRAFGVFTVRRHRIVPPRLSATVGAQVRGVILGESHAAPAELASVAAILAVLDEQRVLHLPDATAASRARLLARSDAIAVALDLALTRRSQTNPPASVAAVL